MGHAGDVRSVDDRVSELRIHYGTGYRLHFTRRGESIVLLLCGGVEKRPDADIAEAKRLKRSLRMTKKAELWDPTERLGTVEAQQIYLEDALENGHPALIVAVIGDIARARGMTEIARSAGISREVLYKSFRLGGNPTVNTLSRVVEALGYRVTFEKAEEKETEAA